MKLVSIIIPVYNTEKYLRKCLDSVVNQTYKNIEIILVNDGSTDESENICKEYENNYKNIKYIKKENGGLSSSRNYGVKQATGEYICFIDSDDYIDENLIDNLKKYMEAEDDIIKYKLIKIDSEYKNEEKISGPTFEEKSGEEAFNELYYQDVMMQPACLYLYKKSFWDENNFSYPEGKFHEDFARTSLIILKAKKVASTNIYGYYYYQSEKSITREKDDKKDMQKAMDLLEHYDYMVKEIDKYNISKETKDNVKKYYTNCIILKVNELSKQNQKKYIKEIRKRKMIKNIKVKNFKQLIKKIALNINIKLYLKLR